MYLECGQVLESAVDVPEELDVVGVDVDRLDGGLDRGSVDLGRQQVQD